MSEAIPCRISLGLLSTFECNRGQFAQELLLLQTSCILVNKYPIIIGVKLNIETCEIDSDHEIKFQRFLHQSIGDYQSDYELNDKLNLS